MATYKVGKDGKAPSGLKAGDKVVTAGGTYTITGNKSGGGYTTDKNVDKNTNTKNYTGSYATAPSGSNGSSGGSSKSPVTIYNPDGTTSRGYISGGKTYYDNGARIGEGATVQAANGKYYQMTNGQGVEVSGPQSSIGPGMTNMPPVDLVNDTKVPAPPIMGGSSLGSLLGVTYDFHTLNNLLQDAAEAKYKTATNEAQQVEGQMYDQAFGFQNDLLSAMKKGQGAVNNGASKGTFDANQLLAMLGYQQQVGDIATQLTQDRQQLAGQYAADKATATQTAQEMANKTGIDLGNLSTMFNANATQFGVGTMDALARIFQARTDQAIANTNAQAQIDAAKATPVYGGGGNSYKSDNSTGASYQNIGDLVAHGDYGTFYYLMKQANVSEKEIQALWDKLTQKANDGSFAGLKLVEEELKKKYPNPQYVNNVQYGQDLNAIAKMYIH